MTKTVLITGCRRGIGKDTAIALSKKGYKVIATTRTSSGCERLDKEFQTKNLDIKTFKLDILKEEDRKKIEKFDLDILINNAAIGESGSLLEIDVEKIRNNFEVNLFSTILLTQIALKKMINKGNGKIIFISSLAGRITMPFLAPYSMTKSALSNGIKALREELKLLKKNIHVVLIEPGGYHTGFNQENKAKKYTWMKNKSYFKEQIEQIRKKENSSFNYEVKTTKSIVKQIIKAVESKKPKIIYSAPWWQYFGIRLLSIFGK